LHRDNSIGEDGIARVAAERADTDPSIPHLQDSQLLELVDGSAATDGASELQHRN